MIPNSPPEFGGWIFTPQFGGYGLSGSWSSPQERVTLRERSSFEWKKNTFLAMTSDGKQLLRGEKGIKTQKTHPERAYGWVLMAMDPWALVDLKNSQEKNRSIARGKGSHRARNSGKFQTKTERKVTLGSTRKQRKKQRKTHVSLVLVTF